MPEERKLNADPRREQAWHDFGRRKFLQATAGGIGWLALSELLQAEQGTGVSGLPHFRPTAKRVIFLHQSGAPSQIELFDPKPRLTADRGRELPASIRRGQRLTSMTSDQKRKPLVGSPYPFARHGQCGMQLSELIPHTAGVADELCLIRSMHTEAINHDPGITFMQTGSEQPGRPSMGAWVHYGLGSANEDLPAFVVFISGGRPGDQPLMGRLWGSGFLPARYQGVKLRGQGDPILYLSDPPGINRQRRRRMIDTVVSLNGIRQQTIDDARVDERTSQFELAYRMQMSIPDLVDVHDEPQQTFQLYGEDAKTPGSYAANCLLARRLAERGVRFIQLYHRGWDHHANLPRRIVDKCKQTDRASAGLIRDLKQRGMLDETLVVFAGEFGRTSYCQGDLKLDDFGRDHHPRCFSIWLAGGGIRGGMTLGSTDDFSYNVVDNPVHIHDLQATIMHCLGIDHERFTYRFQGRDFRLTDVRGSVVSKILS